MELRDKQLTEKIIACAYKVDNTLGPGFLEKVCEFVQTLSRNQEVQLLNCSVAIGIDTGLLINFGTSVAVRRKFRMYKNPANPGKSG